MGGRGGGGGGGGEKGPKKQKGDELRVTGEGKTKQKECQS